VNTVLVYVAGPLSAETHKERMDNVARACAAGKAVLDLGHTPFIPHTNYLYAIWHADMHDSQPDYETFMAWDAEILRRCDGLLYLGASPGADRELAMAEALKLPVYRAVEELPTVRPTVGG